MYGFGVNKLGSIISQTRPTFSLDFASEPALDPRVDFTRASSGTALRRVKYGAESVTNGDFSDGTNNWSTTGSASLSNSSGEGLISVSSLSPNGAYTDQLSLTVGNIYVFTADVRVGTGSTVGLAVLSNNATSILVTSETTTSTSNVSLRLVFVCTDQNSRAYIRCTGSVGTYYVDNVSVKEVTFDTSDGDLVLFNHPNNTPRIEYDADGNLLGLLIEEARTNAFDYSNYFNTSTTNWITSFASISGNVTTSPDGETNASSITETTDANIHSLYQISTLSAAVGTGSFYVKANGRDYCQIRVTGVGTGQAYANFDLQNGVLGTSGGAKLLNKSIEDVGNDWYRISLTVNATASFSFELCLVTSASAVERASYTGDGVSGIYVYGAQIEVGSFPTSYIPTSGSTATRSADVASIATSAFGYRQDEGSFVVECENPFLGSGSIIALNEGISGNSNNRIILTMDGSRTNSIFITTGGVGQAGISKVEIVGQPLTKYGASWKENDVAFVRNGDSAGTDTSATIPNVISNMDIGFYSGIGRTMTTHIKSIKYYPRRLTNAQLQALTS